MKTQERRITVENRTTLQGASDQELCDYYDTHPNLTLVELARRANLSVPAVKKILLK